MAEEKPSSTFLLTERPAELMRRYSVPCIISLLVAALYNIVDQIFIANASYLGSAGNAANTVVYPLTVVALSLAVMVGDGCCAYVSLCLGSGRTEDAHRSVGNAIVLCAAVSLLLTAVHYLCMPALLHAFGGDVSPQTYAYSVEYFTWIAAGIPFYMLGQALNPIIRSDGNPKFAMKAILAGCITNLVLDPVFIFLFRWGMLGAALATVCGQVVSFSWVMYCLTGHRAQYRLMWHNFKLKLQIALDVMAIGFSQFVFQLSSAVLNVILNHALLKYGGNLAISAMGVALSVNTIVIMPTMGISQGAQPLIGYNHGARKYKTSIQTLKMALRWGMLVTTVGFILLEIGFSKIQKNQ